MRCFVTVDHSAQFLLCATIAPALPVAWAVAVNLEPALQRVTRNVLARLQTRWAARANPVV